MSKEQYIAGMRMLASGVSIVATDGEAGKAGITASSVTSVSADPPTLLVCIQLDNLLAKRIGQNGHFSVNLLDLSHKQISNVFAGMGDLGMEARFEHGDWQLFERKPPLLHDALATFVCQVSQTQQVATHLVVFGQVAEAYHQNGEPLIYFDRDYHALVNAAAVSS